MAPIQSGQFTRPNINSGNFPSVSPGRLVAIGASAGGLNAFSVILAALPKNFPAPIVIVQHLSAEFPSRLASILNGLTDLRVKEAEEGDSLQPGHVYIAPPGKHLLVTSNQSLSLSSSAKVHHYRPSADVLFHSVAENCGKEAIGVVLTGGDGDGSSGLHAIKAAGGLTIAQDVPSSQQPSMPRHAAATGSIDFILPLLDIAATLVALVTPESVVPNKSFEKNDTVQTTASRAFSRIQAAWNKADEFLSAQGGKDKPNRLVTQALVEMDGCLAALVLAEQALVDQNHVLESFTLRLREEQLLRHALLNAITEGVIVTDVKGIICEVNLAAATLLGRSVKGMVGRTFAKLSSPGQRLGFEGAMTQALGIEGGQQELDLRLKLKTLRGLPAVIATPSLTRNEEDIPIGLIWLLRLGNHPNLAAAT